MRAQRQIILQAGIIGERRCLLETTRGALVLRREKRRERDRRQMSGGIAAHHRVQGLERVRAHAAFRDLRLELRLGHPGGIVVGAGRTSADARNEGMIVVEPVPRTVVELREAARRRIGDRLQQRRRVAIRLNPENLVDRLGRVDEQRNHLALVVRERREVRRESHCGVFRESCSGVRRRRGGRRACRAGRCAGHGGRACARNAEKGHREEAGQW